VANGHKTFHQFVAHPYLRNKGNFAAGSWIVFTLALKQSEKRWTRVERIKFLLPTLVLVCHAADYRLTRRDIMADD
jgi:hypothetical protein